MSWPPTSNSMDLSGSWEIRRDGDDTWRAIHVPGPWQATLGTDFHGVAWYRRTFDPPANFLAAKHEGRRLWLRFEAVATDLTAWVNDIEVGRHVGDYAPFQFDLTEAIGANETIELLLRVDEIHAPPVENEGDLQNGHITKGFHDVISLQHGGIWQPVHLARTGACVARPDGVAVRADATTGLVTIECELEPGPASSAMLEVRILGPDGSTVAVHRTSSPVDGGACSTSLRVDAPQRWSPRRPNLYRAIVELRDERGVSETHEIGFGFRTIRAVGRTILLNDRPLMVRGVLDWGHEPDHIAPAPGPGEIRARFAHLQAMGFNCVCLCMWYPPRHFFDIADEVGMLIWQEHPVWQSPMRDEDLAEYRGLYDAFLRRDRNHPSVAIVSATCEHPQFHPDLAAWWWDRARAELPDTLLELQTAFFKWADPERTDLHDEHTYDNSNRWVGYVDDVQAHLRELPPMPFVMGETILFTSWPEVSAMLAEVGDDRPWWLPKSFSHMVELEQDWKERFGPETIERFRRQGDRFHLVGRKFQVEQFRRHAGHAGVVMNHLRDVPPCQCGFMDDMGRWRFAAEDFRGWLDDAALLLWTPDHRRAFSARETRSLDCRLALSNFGDGDFCGVARLIVDGCPPDRIDLDGPAGEVRSSPRTIVLPPVDAPTRVRVRAEADGLADNHWDLWLFPEVEFADTPSAIRFSALPYEPRDAEPDDVERGYSRGYGLPVRDWQCVLPNPAVLAQGIRGWDGNDSPPADARLLLTHRLAFDIIDWLERGGNVILFASKAPGGLGTSYEWLFGQVPLVLETGPLGPGDSEWIVDLLGYDLTRRYARVIPIESLGLADRVDPLIRLVYTHDQSRVKLFDMLFHTRVGRGRLMVSSLDHSEAPGRFLLRRMIEFMTGMECALTTMLSPDELRRFAIESVR